MKNVFNFLNLIFLNSLISSHLVHNKIRRFLLNIMGHEIEGVVSANCGYGSGKGKIIIGNGSFINYNCFFDRGNDIYIGKCCNIAYQVTFCTSTHNKGNKRRRAGSLQTFPINIEDGCWIGANTMILPGVTIGKGCIIGSGSVVNKDCEPNGLYVGVPAKRIKDLE